MLPRKWATSTETGQAGQVRHSPTRGSGGRFTGSAVVRAPLAASVVLCGRWRGVANLSESGEAIPVQLLRLGGWVRRDPLTLNTAPAHTCRG